MGVVRDRVLVMIAPPHLSAGLSCASVPARQLSPRAGWGRTLVYLRLPAVVRRFDIAASKCNDVDYATFEWVAGSFPAPFRPASGEWCWLCGRFSKPSRTTSGVDHNGQF